MDATLGGHRSAQAADIVSTYLAERADLGERLRWTVHTSLDELARAARHP